jgi:hypothetical protein
MASPEAKAEDRARPLDTPVELRVHGVGGTTPDILLRHPHPEQVAGDDTAGFYRRPDSNELEAYTWGGITSRSGSRALWLLLLPFALANAAGFMLPPGNDTRLRVARGLIRVLALSVTVLAVLWAGGLGLDLIAFQCGGSSVCTSRHWWLTFFEGPYFADRPVRRVVVGLLIPVSLIALWRLATRFTRTRYEDAFTSEPVEIERALEGDLAAQATLADRQFWHSPRFGARLASGHFAAATSALAAATAYAIQSLRVRAGFDVGVEAVLFVIGLLILIGAIATVAFDGQGPTWALSRAGWILLAGVAVVGLVRPGPANPSPGDLPGYSRLALVTGLLALVIAVVLLLVLAEESTQRWKPVATAALALWALISLLAGSHVRLADWLGDRVVDPTQEGQATIFYSNGYDWFALASLALVSGAILAVVIAAIWLWRRAHSAENVEAVAREYPGVPADMEGLRWIRSIIRARSVARLSDEAATALGVLLAVVLGATLAFYGIRVFTTGSPFGAFVRLPDAWRRLVPLASWVGSMLPIAGLAMMYSSFRSPGTRRRVGVIWDVITFWPRWYHPLAPPPYSARAVPELGIRLRRLTGDGAAVTLSGHSQGSVLAAASLARLPAEIRARIALLTHGSPLRRLYGLFFPDYFGANELSALADRIDGRWINLFRATDAIGGPIGIGDRHVPDPVSAERQPGDPLPPVRGHTFYQGDGYDQAIAELRHELSRASS